MNSNTKEYKREASKKHYNKKYEFAYKYKLEKGCAICGYNEHPAALQFDHINPEDKHEKLKAGGKWSSKRSLTSLGWKDMIAEMEKCRILCANCHAIHSVKQKAYLIFKK